jgi:hypothetical protein
MSEASGLHCVFPPLFKRGAYLFLRVSLVAFAVLALSLPRAALAQSYDCAGLQAKIADLDRGGGRGGRGSGPTQQQLAQLSQTITTARALGCDRPEIAFTGGAGGRCPGLNAQIQQMQATIGALQAGGSPADRAAARADLVARFNTYCRNQPPAPPRQRGFFEQLFGIPGPSESPPPMQQGPFEDVPQEADDAQKAHGGSQAVCVRTCDGGYFPLSVSARGADSTFLTNLCEALCPNTTVAVYTRAPNSQIETAVSLDGAPYSEMPNALKFQKSFDAACTCKPPGQSWVEALAGADRVLGGERKSDILVTPEKAAELSAPKPDNRNGADANGAPPSAAASAEADAAGASRAGAAQNQSAGATREIVGADGVKRRVRIVGPRL